MTTATITVIGGPTALIESHAFRLVTDPTFDDPGAAIDPIHADGSAVVHRKRRRSGKGVQRARPREAAGGFSRRFRGFRATEAPDGSKFLQPRVSPTNSACTGGCGSLNLTQHRGDRTNAKDHAS